MQILKDLRKRGGLTLRQIEEATGISNAYLSQLENGKIKHPSAQSLYTLAKLYSTDIEYLLIASGMVKEDERITPLKESVEQRLERLERDVDRICSRSRSFQPSRCCGRCDGVSDICVVDKVCDLHKVEGCEICFGAKRCYSLFT